MNIPVLVVLLVGLLVIILLAPKLKLQLGICVLTLVYFTGVLGMGLTVSKVHNYFPGNQFILMTLIMLFFGVSAENGAIVVLVKKIMSKISVPGWVYPVVLYWISFIISGLGLGTGGTPVLAWPFICAIAVEIGWKLDVAVATISVAICSGYLSPLAAGGPTLQALISAQGFEGEEAMALYWPVLFKTALLCFIPCLIYMVVRGCFKDIKAVKTEDPGDFTPVQKKYLIMVAVYVVLAVFFIVMSNFVGGPFWKKMAQVFDVNMLALLGSVCLVIFKVADVKMIIRNVPFDLIMNVGAIMMLTTMATECGFVEIVGGFIAKSVPPMFIAVFFLILSAILSAVSSGIRVVMPMVFPLVPMICAQYPQLSASTLFCASAIGATITTGSSFSNSGAKLCSLIPDKELGQKVYSKNMYMPYIILILCAAVMLVGQVVGIL